MTRERRLGRGLEALLGRVAAATGEAGGQLAAERPAGEHFAHSQPAPASAPTAPADAPRFSSHQQVDAIAGLRQEAGYAATQGSLLPEAAAGASQQGASLREPAVPPAEDAQSNGSPLLVDLCAIDRNPFQPRQEFDATELQALADSLRAHGLLQPVVVRRVGERFQLIAGERRLQAAAKAGWSSVPVHVVEADDRELAELAIVENLHRKDLNPLEKAASFQRYLTEYNATQEELASRLKLDRSTIANLIRLLELPEAVQEAIRQGKITQGHARALLPLGDEREQVEFCWRIQQEGLSVRRTEALVQEMIAAADAEPLGIVGRDGSTARVRRPKSDHLAALEQEFRIALGTKVKITHSARGRGKLVIQFANHQEFERIRQHICGPGHLQAAGQVG